MNLHGKNFLGGELSGIGTDVFWGFNPKDGKRLEPEFHQATEEEINFAMKLAADAAPRLAKLDSSAIAGLLRAIGQEISDLGDALIERAMEETALGKDRLTGERARTVNQLNLFASVVEEGSFVDARIDTALPDRKPLPRPDLRRMMLPVGPILVFAASNFPFAFSVAGGDTASALAARNPVILKAHPAHPATSELVAGAIIRAVQKLKLPEGTFSLLHATSPEASVAMVQNPAIKAVAFTGSERAGRALFDAAGKRPVPIPVFAEMGSINPVFLLPGAIAKDADQLAKNLFGSVTLGVGQFCTSPGVTVGQQSAAFDAFRKSLQAQFAGGAAGTMLYGGIQRNYQSSVEKIAKTKGVHTTASPSNGSPHSVDAEPVLFETDAKRWLDNPDLRHEVFGPGTFLVPYDGPSTLLEIAKQLPGTLTATIFGTPEDLAANVALIQILETKAGRLIFNGFPTGVEVCAAMQHGGPYPATTDSRFTSVGTAAIERFLRPVCFQGFPQNLLPEELQDANPRGIWRLVNGDLTRNAIGVQKAGA